MASETREHAGSYHRTLLDRLDTLADINAPLLAWYGTREGLPWRTDLSDAQLAAMTAEEKAQRAYEVWVSEIMLQQTQVATVIPYYQRWIAAFPTVASLAQADIEQVNSLWKGLGYYSRASRLLDGAKTVMSRYGGRLPSDAKTLVEQIEGIGPYTAGAISSIAFGARAATVDGNIQRVICRLLAIHADMKKKATLDYIWQVAEELVPESRAGHWNQALMDLGATVCTPKNPKCGGCPLKSACLAYAEVALPRTAGVLAQSSSESVDIEDISSPEPKPAPKKQAKTKATNKAKSSSASVCDMCLPMDPAHRGRDVTVYPCKVAKKASREEDIAVCVLEWQGGEGEAVGRKVLLVKRPKTGLLAGLDEFPSVIVEDAAPSLRSQASLALLHELLVLPPDFELASSNLTSTVSDLGSIKHIYSHINATFHVSHVVLLSNEGVPPKIRKGARERCRWVSRAEVESANISTGAVKVWSLVKSGVKAVKVKAPSKRKAGASHARSAAGPQLGQSKLAFGRKVQVQEEEMTASSSKENEVGEAAVSVAVAVTASLATTTSPRKKRRIVVSSDEEV